MIFVTGGLASGKRTYVQSLGYSDSQISVGELGDGPVVLDAQELVRDACGGKEVDLSALVEQLAAKDIVACVDVGSGVVPLERDERDWRDRVGTLSCALADRADAVVRLTCGVPVALKGNLPAIASAGEGARWTPSSPYLGKGQNDRTEGADAKDDVPEITAERARKWRTPVGKAEAKRGISEEASDTAQTPLESVELIIMRHGATKGNEERRYVGALDHPLSPLGCSQAVAAGIHPEVDRVYVTTLVRSQQTAAICFPCAEQVMVDGLQEMDFGTFAGRTADEMADDAEYRAWVEGYCEGQCPEGESREQASNRICRALGKLVLHAQKAGEKRVILVAHGGTLMAAFDRYSVDFPDKNYFTWNTGNCQGYVTRASVTKGGTFTLDDCAHFSNLDFLNGE